MRVAPRRLALVLLVALTLLGFSACASKTKAKAVILPTPTKGALTVTVDSASYAASQPIGVTVTNGGKVMYFATADQTDCTFLQLQQLDTKQNQWQRVSPCGAAGQTSALQIPGGIVEPFTLSPGIPGNSSYRNSWPAGEYRVAVLYTDAATGGHSAYAFSAGFLIR
ncbi:MAG TPA: hypothetical protein VJN88_03370 [Ktedonobacterales bacterium]|nr:hypothetical protein [Ktedonobacterales bacterium]